MCFRVMNEKLSKRTVIFYIKKYDALLHGKWMDFCFSDPEEMADFPPPLPVQKPVGGPPTPAKPARKVRPYKATSAGLSEQQLCNKH